MGEGADQADKAKDESKITRIQRPYNEVASSSQYSTPVQSRIQLAILSRADETCPARIDQERLI
jgi:hypothetical protein